MAPDAMRMVQTIGHHLSRDEYPRVYDGGVVRPCAPAIAKSDMGLDDFDEPTRPRRPSARPWERTAGWQRPTHRSWPPHEATPLVSAELRFQYENNLSRVRNAYPGTNAWLVHTGMWLHVPSTIVPGLSKAATFTIFVPFIVAFPVKAWAFWLTPIELIWIGPRHTNFPDGSICAFEPGDNTWRLGDDLVQLLDLFTLWAFRHLHLEAMGYWPGRQSVRHPYERLSELKDDEMCGCHNPAGTYAECCKQADCREHKSSIAGDFLVQFSWGIRRPPKDIINFQRDRSSLPCSVALYQSPGRAIPLNDFSKPLSRE